MAIHIIALGVGMFSLIIGLAELWFGRLPGSSSHLWGYRWLASRTRVRLLSSVGIIVSCGLILTNLPNAWWDMIVIGAGIIGGVVVCFGISGDV